MKGPALLLPLVLTCSTFSTAHAQIMMGGSRIDVVFESKETGVPQSALFDWIETSAGAVTKYYGRFPLAHVVVQVRSVAGDKIESGTTYGTRDGGLIRIAVGRDTTHAHFAADWLMTHEMVHLAFPNVADEHHWIEEGIATYIEPIARARIGQLSAEEVWSEFVRDLPQGLPQPGDRGLDFTHTWGRTYWGGALFCLLADIEIHRRTANMKGLDSALRGILEAGGSISVNWDLERALKAGDSATNVAVLEQLYTQMRDAPHPVDLENLWHQLGVERGDKGVTLNNEAPLASVRQAIIYGE